MRRFALLALLLAAPSSATAAVTTAWSALPGGVAIATDASNNVYTATSDINPGSEIVLTKRNAAGVVQWNVSANAIDVGYEVASWITVDPDGNIVVTGTLQGGSLEQRTNRAGLVMKFSPAGQVLWSRLFDGIDNGSSVRRHVVDAAGNVYVLGIGAGVIAKVIKFSPAGTAVWAYGGTVTAPLLTAPFDIRHTADGALLVLTSVSSTQGLIYAKLTTDGVQVWRMVRTGVGIAHADGDALGNTYVARMDPTQAAPTTVVSKLSPAGALLWETVRAGMGSPFVVVGPDNEPVVVGYTVAGGATAVKYDGTGNVVWANLDADGPQLIQPWLPTQVDDGGNVYAMGFFGMFKVNADGTSGWTLSGGNWMGFSVGTDRSVFTVGGSTARLTEEPATTPSADLGLDVSPSVAGQVVSYLATVTNAGPSAATGVAVTGSSITMTSCTIGTLAAGASANCILTETLTLPGSYGRTLNVAGAESDPNASNDSFAVVVTVTAPVASADLSLTMTDAPDPARRGKSLVYTMVIANGGPNAASGVTLVDALPGSLVFVSASTTQGRCTGSTTVTCSIGTLASGGRATVRVTVKPRVTGTIRNTASVSSATPGDPNALNNVATATTSVR